MSIKFSESKKFLLEENPNQNNEKTKFFLEIVERVQVRGTKTIDLEPFKTSLNLPIERLPELEEIKIIYDKLRKKSKCSKKNWSFNENQLLIWLVLNYCLLKEISPLSLPEQEIKEILSIFPGKSFEQAKFKWFSLRKCHLYSTPWTKEEDDILKRLIMEKGSNKWNEISKEMNKISALNVFRLGKQCRERWNNHLDPSLNRGPWTEQEDFILLNSILEVGKKWSDIAKKLSGRTENSVKNRFISLMNKEKSQINIEEEGNDLPDDNSIDSETSDDIEETALINSLIFNMEQSSNFKSSKNQKNIKVKKNILIDLVTQEKKTKEEEKDYEYNSNNNTHINNVQIFTPNTQPQIKEESTLNESFFRTVMNNNMNTPNINFDTTKLLNSSNASKMQEVLKKDFANFFLGNQNPLVTLVHGIQLIRFSLHILQKEFNKLAENNIINQEKKLVNLKDFNSLLCENNFQDIQLSFFNPIKNDVYLLNPMTETELNYLEMNVDTQNTLINLSKYNNINNNSNFLGIPQNFSPFPMAGHQFISPKFTPIINRNYNHQLLHPMNLMNANNMLGYNSIQSNFSSPATNYNPYSNHNEFLLQRLLENMNNPNLNQSLDKNILNNVINNNNINNNPNNNLINTKMEIDESANFTKKWTK